MSRSPDGAYFGHGRHTTSVTVDARLVKRDRIPHPYLPGPHNQSLNSTHSEGGSASQATRAKVLWIYILERQALEESILPLYLKDYEQLDSSTIEALVRRVSSLAHKWETQDLSPVRSWKLHLPLAISWLRLVAGKWLFVASSDNSSSKISCWDLSCIFQGSIEPLAEAYLPGQVKTGKLEVQQSGVVLALGLGPEAQAVHVLTLREHRGCRVFAELCCIKGSSHVLMLSGDLIACALRHGDNVPHIINWTTQRVHEIPPPDDLNIPCRRSVPHLITIWNSTLLILRRNTVELYTLPSVNDSIALLKVIQTPTIWEAAVLPSAPSLASPLRLITISPVGVEICVIEDLLTGLDQAGCSNFCLDPVPEASDPHYRPPWYRLCVGDSGRRFLRISTDEVEEFDRYGFPKLPKPPHLVFSAVTPQSSTFSVESPPIQKVPRIAWDTDGKPALGAIPVIDFDEALGLTVVGNISGDLAICDHAGQNPECCADLAMDFTDQKSSVPPLLPTTLLKLDLPVAPTLEMSDSDLENCIATWSQDNLNLQSYDPDSRWENTWISRFTNYDRPGYNGIKHAYGFPGRVVPQAFQRDPRSDGHQTMLFRLGHRYFAFRCEGTQFLSFAGTPSGMFDIVGGQVETVARPTAMTERHAFQIHKAEEEGWHRMIEERFPDEDYTDPDSESL
ncbi:hypothetical protein C8R45DRAFT_930749 [Mycena sanguinolenta]|nr:hypothetical protein C8R45DRAFT_930749 [Mycena sanguinolenta]